MFSHTAVSSHCTTYTRLGSVVSTDRPIEDIRECSRIVVYMQTEYEQCKCHGTNMCRDTQSSRTWYAIVGKEVVGVICCYSNSDDFLMGFSHLILRDFPDRTSLYSDDKTQSTFGSSGDIAVLLDICKYHKNNATVIQNTLWAIRNACRTNCMR